MGYFSNFPLLQVNAGPRDNLEDRVIEGMQDHRVQEVNQVLQDRQVLAVTGVNPGLLVSIRHFHKHTELH